MKAEEKRKYEWPEGEEIVYLRPPVEEYHGKLSCFYHPDAFPELNPLKDNWGKIKDEILTVEKKEGLLKEVNSLSHANTEGEGLWSSIYLKSFNRLFRKNMRKFPITMGVVNQIPNCVFACLSVLPPKTSVKPHYGDTNGIVRVQLALIVPEPYPIIGIRVGDEERGWEEGELLSFINVQKHEVWNNSDKRRYVLIIDIIPKVLLNKKDEICTKALGSQTFIFFYTKSAFARKLPLITHGWFCSLFTLIWRIYLPIQKRVNFL